MELTRLIKHPEEMNKETLYGLRSLLALYPYYQTARLLLLQNLYILHDPSFDEEIRRAAIYITDRKVIFQMIEAAHYRLRKSTENEKTVQKHTNEGEDRTSTLIDNFLDSIPSDIKDDKGKRKPTPADAAVDYVAYLLETESEEDKESSQDTPKMKGQSLIDSFLKDGGFNLNFEEEELPKREDRKSTTQKYADSYEDITEEEDDDYYNYDSNNEEADIKKTPERENTYRQTQQKDKNETNEGYFTETLAQIYIKQGRYEKALEIIQRLNLNFPKKNAYFADQMRFLEKLILNNKNKK